MCLECGKREVGVGDRNSVKGKEFMIWVLLKKEGLGASESSNPRKLLMLTLTLMVDVQYGCFAWTSYEACR